MNSDWMATTGKVVAAVWAAFWTWFGLASGTAEGLPPIQVILHAALPGLLFFLLWFVALRWERAGGALLVFSGVVLAVLYPLTLGRHFPLSTSAFVVATMALPPLIAGLLFLKHWRRGHSSPA